MNAAAASMMPELGSKISLISKADIRYEGRLFTVDPQECTIALANVRSFGTEDRETPYPIAPQPTVYDYILFRGSDIKDIRVVNNVHFPNDPAIMQLQMPNQMPQQQPQPGFPQNFPMQQQPGGQIGFGPFGQLAQQQQGGPPGGPNIGGIPIGGQNNPQQQPSQQQQQQQAQSLSPNQLQQQSQSNQQQDSRSGTPNARKSPTSDMGVQTNQNQLRDNTGNKERNQRNNNQRNSNFNNRERRDSGRNEVQNERREGGGGGSGFRQNQRPQQMQRGGYNNNHNRNNNNQMRGNQGGSGRMRVPPQFYRQNQNKQQNGQQRGNKNQNTLKFDNEFDFEQANSKFEELRSQLAKLKVGSEENKQTPEQQVNGEAEKKDDSGNETGADHEAESEEAPAYDKSKSFFDNISCEAVERSKGKPQRPDWRQERKINSETFGYSTNRRGNMRGRNYYRPTYNNRSMNNYRSGGPQQNRNYNNRNRNNNSGRNNNNPVQQPTQNQPQPVAAAN